MTLTMNVPHGKTLSCRACRACGRSGIGPGHRQRRRERSTALSRRTLTVVGVARDVSHDVDDVVEDHQAFGDQLVETGQKGLDPVVASPSAAESPTSGWHSPGRA